MSCYVAVTRDRRTIRLCVVVRCENRRVVRQFVAQARSCVPHNVNRHRGRTRPGYRYRIARQTCRRAGFLSCRPRPCRRRPRPARSVSAISSTRCVAVVRYGGPPFCCYRLTFVFFAFLQAMTPCQYAFVCLLFFARFNRFIRCKQSLLLSKMHDATDRGVTVAL